MQSFSFDLQKAKEDVENDLRHEIRDLKERLKMGADEYKYKYLECRKLQADIRKLRREGKAKKYSKPK